MKQLTGDTSVLMCTWIVLACCGGCATGPFPELAQLNPMLQQEWKIDKKYGPTLRDQLAELETVQKSAGQNQTKKNSSEAKIAKNGLG